MSREIKFRAWDKEECYMILNAMVRFDGKVFCVMCPEHEDLTNKVELMQYAGLKDKNDKEIYEGDIVLFGDKKRKILYCVGSAGYISFRCEDNLWPLRLGEIARKPLEVIGNIYENPELLE